jgi:hypothetical protein
MLTGILIGLGIAFLIVIVVYIYIIANWGGIQ